MAAETYALDPEYGDYFDDNAHRDESGWPIEYIPGEFHSEKPAPKYERQWTIAQILNALIDAGLAIERLGEHPDPYWNAFPNLPADTLRRLPQTLSVLARKPG